MVLTASPPQTPAAAATKDTQNDVTRPKAGTKTGRIWEIADSLSAQEGAPVARKKVLEAAMAEVERLSGEIADGGEAYPVGVREIARRLAAECEAGGNTIKALAGRS